MIIRTMIKRYPDVKPIEKAIRQATDCIEAAFKKDRQLLLCGNGGSASDSDHIATEFLKGFMSKRPIAAKEKKSLVHQFGEKGAFLAERLQVGFKAIPLTEFAGLSSAFANDVAPELIFAQMVNAIGRKGDILFCISTSGTAENVAYAAMTAKAKGLTVIALTGLTGGKLQTLADITILAPGACTPDVQERHLPIYHAICREVEARLIKK